MYRITRLFTFSLLCLILAVWGTSCGNDDSLSKAQTLDVGDSCPEFQVTDMNNGTHKMPDPDMPSVIYFFHTDCPDCQQQFPIIQQLFDEYKEKCHFIGIGRAQNAEDIKSYVLKMGYTLPVAADESRSIYNLFARRIVPRVYIVSNGIIRLATTDSNPLDYNKGHEILNQLTTHNNE